MPCEGQRNVTKSRRQASTDNKAKTTFPDDRIVKVTFTDPTEFDTRFGDLKEPVECVTVGWLTELSKKSVKVAWLFDRGDISDSTGLILPRGCVKDIARLRTQLQSSQRRVLAPHEAPS